jgi:HEXXH motif-containing protein
LCAGPATGDTMALLVRSQHSHRRLALRALLDQLQANPKAVGQLVEPEEAWQVLAESEQRDPGTVADIFLYPTFGVWLTRALHHTRAGRTTPWPELGYLHAIAAAAAIRSGYSCTIRVPVTHGMISLPTVGYARIPGAFPIGSVNVVCAGGNSRIQVNQATTIFLDDRDPSFTRAQQRVSTRRGLTLRTWVEGRDPYHGFGEPRPPLELGESEFAEWHKLIEEAWDIITLNHPGHARELAAGLRVVGPIEPDADTVGASSPAAFGAIRLSNNGSATDFAEALIHEMQHSKLNALLELVKLADDDHARRYLAPWRDDPRPLVGLVHGIYAFTCGVEFWLTQQATAHELDDSRRIAFHIAYRRAQVRRAIGTLKTSGRLTRPGHALVDAVSKRLAVCERHDVAVDMARTVTMMIDDHHGLWQLRHARPDEAVVKAMASAWLDRASAPPWFDAVQPIIVVDERPLPANRRTLLRAKAAEPDLFASLIHRPGSLPSNTPRADAALCTGAYENAATSYTEGLHLDPDDAQAWVGLGLALNALGRNASALLEHPELTVAVHRRVRGLSGRAPDPAAISAWVSSAL